MVTRRQDRRERIAAAFDDFRRAVGAALGAAAASRDAAVLRHASALFEMWLRGEGLDAARRDPSLARALANPRLAEPLRRVLADQRAVFGGWVATEPERLTRLVSDAAP